MGVSMYIEPYIVINLCCMFDICLRLCSCVEIDRVVYRHRSARWKGCARFSSRDPISLRRRMRNCSLTKLPDSICNSAKIKTL